MELRRCSHYHYIQALKGGIITKVLNVNSSGKPAFKFKKVTDIYGSVDGVAHRSLSALWSKDGLEENTTDRREFKVENPLILYAERKLVKDELDVSDCDSKSDTDVNNSDVEVDSMTLKQIMDGCKKRKLRQAKSLDSDRKKHRTVSGQNVKHSCFPPDVDDSDLYVSLSFWKSKLSKRKKVKAKCEERKISSISECGQIVGKSDPVSEEDQPSSSESSFPVVIKVEVPETDLKEIQNTNYISEKLPLHCEENLNFCLTAEPVGADELLLDSGGSTTSEEKALYCVLNRACRELLEGDDPMVKASSTQDTDEDDLATREIPCSDFPASETMEGQYAMTCISKDAKPEASSLTEEQSSENICQTSGEILADLHGITNLNSSQFTETNCEGGVCLTENEYKDAWTSDHETNTSTESTSDCKSSTEQILLSVDNPSARENRTQISEYSDKEGSSLPEFQLYDAEDESNQFQDTKSQDPPARLLSTRTTISPTSQARLSKAMEHMQLHDKECKTGDGKPYFEQTKNKEGTAEECDKTKRIECDRNHEKTVRKSKKRSFLSTSSTKISHAGTRSTAVQSSSNNVIAFTQRQMQDIEYVAMKLTNHLKTMKAIAEDRLHVEGYKASTSKFNVDEVRTAIADATKMEGHARKWLSIMSRDCNRFCKIMKTTENSSADSQSAVQKIKKKIMFADEAGGELCQVRVIEDDVESFSEPNSGRYETVQ